MTPLSQTGPQTGDYLSGVVVKVNNQLCLQIQNQNFKLLNFDVDKRRFNEGDRLSGSLFVYSDSAQAEFGIGYVMPGTIRHVK